MDIIAVPRSGLVRKFAVEKGLPYKKPRDPCLPHDIALTVCTHLHTSCTVRMYYTFRRDELYGVAYYY